MMAVLHRRPFRGSIIFGVVHRCGVYHVAGLGVMTQRGLDRGHGLMDSHKAVAPSSVMVTSTAEKMKIIQIFIIFIKTTYFLS
jgi:hypothetical protein